MKLLLLHSTISFGLCRWYIPLLLLLFPHIKTTTITKERIIFFFLKKKMKKETCTHTPYYHLLVCIDCDGVFDKEITDTHTHLWNCVRVSIRTHSMLAIAITADCIHYHYFSRNVTHANYKAIFRCCLAFSRHWQTTLFRLYIYVCVCVCHIAFAINRWNFGLLLCETLIINMNRFTPALTKCRDIYFAFWAISTPCQQC